MRIIKAVSAVLMIALLSLTLTFCGAMPADSGKLTVVTTVFASYDWVKEISKGQDVEIVYLADNGVDMHNYKPTAKDIAKISTCDLFVYVGGSSDGWVENALKSATGKDIKTINMMDVIGNDVLAEAVCAVGDDHDHDHSDESFDEHIWLSLDFAKTICGVICEKMTECDPEGADTYKKNYENYMSELSGLRADFQSSVSSAKGNTLIFCDRFPFIYLINDLGLEYFAALPGCSTESSVSFDTIITLANAVDSHGVSAVLKIEGSDSSIADSVITSSKNGENVKILTLNSLQSVTESMINNGTTYISVMRDNLTTIAEALG